MGVDLEWCPCGKASVRQAVNQVAIGHKSVEGFRDYWHNNSSIRAAHEEALGYAAETRQIAAEETANGFKPGKD